VSTHIPEGYGQGFAEWAPPRGGRVEIDSPGVARALDLASSAARARLVASLVGVHEIAAYYGVTRRSVGSWARSDGFPRPLVRLAMGPVYLLDEVDAWHEGGKMRLVTSDKENRDGENAQEDDEPARDHDPAPSAPEDSGPPWARDVSTPDR